MLFWVPAYLCILSEHALMSLCRMQGSAINKSLLTLGNVIRALGDKKVISSLKFQSPWSFLCVFSEFGIRDEWKYPAIQDKRHLPPDLDFMLIRSIVVTILPFCFWSARDFTEDTEDRRSIVSTALLLYQQGIHKAVNLQTAGQYRKPINTLSPKMVSYSISSS